MWFPLYVTYCFSLVAFHILSFCLVFVSLISMCLGVFLHGFTMYGTLGASWTWLTIFFPILGKFSSVISSKIFLYVFFFCSSSMTPIIQMLVHLILSQWSLRLSCFFFFSILFTLLCSTEVISNMLSFSSLISSSASDILLLIPSRVFLISVIRLFVSLGLFFYSSRSLLIDSCIFSTLFSQFLIFLLSLFWILFQVVCLLPPNLFGLLFLVYSFICVVFLCLFITIFNVLCLKSLFPSLQCWIRSFFWFPPS